jgi:sterol desaturase/sphingolipid hydroxylase (fatty acid hydroxylase superfamily)
MNLPESSFGLWLLVSAFFVARYFLLAGIPFLVFYVFSGKEVKSGKIQKNHPSKEKILKEIFYSLASLLIYGSGIWLFIVWLEAGNTLLYKDISDFGIPYFIISFFLMILIHDTYFYWTHRLIHHKFLFRHIHKVHHQFSNPTPWAAFSFHPLEAILSMGVIPIIIFCIPWHQSALIAFITFMTLYDVYIHLGYDLKQLRLGQWQNTAADHNHHHQNSRVNFGLYFRIWDHLMGTYRKLPNTV